MIVKSLKVERTVVKMVHHKWQLIRLINILNFLRSKLLVYLEKTEELAPLKYCLTHYIL